MKLIKRILWVIAVLVVAFLAMGLLNKSVDYGHEITVNKPIAEAWAVSQDETRLAQWLEGFKSMELISGQKGVAGSQYRIVVNPGEGQEDFVMTETLESIKEHDHASMTFDSDMMDFEQTMTFSEQDGKTTIRTDSKVIGKGILMRSMFATMELFGNAFEKQETKNLEALKVLIETNTTNY